MSVVLETRSYGGVVIGVLVHSRIDRHSGGGRVTASGVRRPIAVVIKADHRLDAFDANGDRLSVTDLQKRYPQQLAALTAVETA